MIAFDVITREVIIQPGSSHKDFFVCHNIITNMMCGCRSVILQLNLYQKK